jgi:beta-N-acetylhexosaminidase
MAKRAEVAMTVPRLARRLFGAALLLLAGTAVIGSFGRRVAQPASVAAQTPAPASCTPAQVFAKMTLAQRVGQLFMVGLRSGVADDLAARTDQTITELHAGNVVLYGSTWNAGPVIGRVTDRLTKLAIEANAGVQPFISGNQEGGQAGAFQAFYGQGFSAMPSPIYQAQGNPNLLMEQARVWGVQLSNAGVNLNLAPVLDTVPPGTQIENSPIGYWGREYGFSTDDVTTYGVAFMRGMRAAPIALSIKHFPGLGRVVGNTDFTDQRIIDDQFGGLGDPYLAPYKAAIDAGADFVMMSLAYYPRVDSVQAAFSRTIVTDILRNGLGFQGVIITDDVGQAAAVANRTPAQRALDFFHAGGDMVLTVVPSDIEPMIYATLAEMERDPAFRANIEASVMRVLKSKANYQMLPTKDCG